MTRDFGGQFFWVGYFFGLICWRGVGPEFWLSVGGLNRKSSVIQSNCVCLGAAKGILSFFALERWMGYVFGLVRRGSPIQLCVCGSYHFFTKIPHVSRGWGGPRGVAIGHWERRVKSENNGLGSPVQLHVWGPAKGMRRVISFLHHNPPSCILLTQR